MIEAVALLQIRNPLLSNSGDIEMCLLRMRHCVNSISIPRSLLLLCAVFVRLAPHLHTILSDPVSVTYFHWSLHSNGIRFSEAFRSLLLLVQPLLFTLCVVECEDASLSANPLSIGSFYNYSFNHCLCTSCSPFCLLLFDHL